jgi:hypothetical protein
MIEPTTAGKITTFLSSRPLVVLLLFFLLSVAVRLPNLSRPLSKHHELNAALVLINSEEWDRKSPSFYHFIPVHSYHFPGDKIFNGGENLANGVVVNVTVPPLWYILPYGFFHLFNVAPSALLLQIFNILLHLVCVLLMFNLVKELLKGDKDAVKKALITCVIYLFAPSPLWFHGNGYVHEVAVLPFIFSACLIYLRIIKNVSPPLYNYLLLSVLIIAGIMCDWLMCFVAAAMFIASFYTWGNRKGKTQRTLVLLIPGSVILALLLVTMQASSLMGFENYARALSEKFIMRSITGDVQSGGILKKAGIISFYILGYGLILPFLIYAGFLVKPFRQQLQENFRLKLFVIIGSTVCILHHMVFWGFSNIHDYSVVKSGLLISLLSSIALFTLSKARGMIFLVVLIVINTSIYYLVNRPGKFAVNGQPYSYFQSLGKKIKAIALPGEYVFVDIPEMSLLLTYYSKRTYRNVNSIEDANKIFKDLPGDSALFIHTDNFEFVNYQRLLKK